MKCFYHETVDAVATCKNCCKALCRQCAVDVGNGMACRDSCEEQVRVLNATLKKGQSAIKRSRLGYCGVAIFMILMAIVIGQDSVRSDMRGWAILGDGMSVVFLMGGVFFLVMAKKIAADRK